MTDQQYEHVVALLEQVLAAVQSSPKRTAKAAKAPRVKPPTATDKIREALKDGPLHYLEIAKRTGLAEQTVQNAGHRMPDVRRVGRRRWRVREKEPVFYRDGTWILESSTDTTTADPQGSDGSGMPTPPDGECAAVGSTTPTTTGS